jgi:hypothetical protein
MAEPGDVLPRAAGIELLLQTEPELARALERSYPPSSEGMAVTPFDDDDEYMLAAELRFTLTSLHLQALCTLRTLAVGGNRRPIYADRYGEGKDSACSPTETAQRVRALREMRDKHAAAMEERLGATSKVPRVVAVADAYGLSQVEASVRELLVLQPSVPKCCNPQCPSAATLSAQVLQPLCGASAAALVAQAATPRAQAATPCALRCSSCSCCSGATAPRCSRAACRRWTRATMLTRWCRR